MLNNRQLGDVIMKKISINQIENCISEALKENKKNILFVSITAEYDKVLDWAENHPEYCVRRDVPREGYENKNGILVKSGYDILSNEILKILNNENVIWFHNYFSEKCIGNFEGVINVVKERIYTQKFSDSEIMKFSLEKMSLFIAFTTPNNPNDFASLDEKYYKLFDEVYLLD